MSSTITNTWNNVVGSYQTSPSWVQSVILTFNAQWSMTSDLDVCRECRLSLPLCVSALAHAWCSPQIHLVVRVAADRSGEADSAQYLHATTAA